MTITTSQETTVRYTLISDGKEYTLYFATRDQYREWWNKNWKLVKDVTAMAH